MRSKTSNITIFVLVILLGAAAALLNREVRSPPPAGTDYASGEKEEGLVFSEADLAAISVFAHAHWHGVAQPAPATLRTPSEGVYIAARERGTRHAETWGFGTSAASGLADGITKLRDLLGDKVASIDTLEVFVIAGSQEVENDKKLFSNIRRGIHGLAVRHDKEWTLHSPTYAVASNRKNERLIELYLKEHKLSRDERGALQLRFLRGPQLLVSLGLGERQAGTAIRMERGNTYQAIEEVTQASVEAFAKRMATWMTANLHDDGRMTYLFWPSRNEEAVGRDNLIRQFMATIALGRIAARLPADQAPAAWQGSASNIEYNLAKYYRTEGELGFVEGRGSSKLGAIALAALAIVEHRDRLRWQEQEQALLRTVQSLWREDGSFRSFYKPASRNDNQNFYPGEALLLWATLYSKSNDEALLAQFMKSFEYYKAWHLDESVANRRNPAFTPWHTQAYYLVWTHTKDSALKDFIFAMNDWLLPIQEWQGTRYPDTKGRFHDSSRPFGPPHASSTGVYLEGLVDAYALAKQVGDNARAQAYATAIRRGLRSSMQLQFADEVDMFYVSNRDPVFGGLRTTVYDNQIRCDNVQHTLMGTQKILELGLLPVSSGAVKTLPTSR